MTSVSRETQNKLESYVQLLHSWDRRISLIGPSHRVVDLQRLTAEAQELHTVIPQIRSRWMDLGSGNGLPAIPLLIWRQGLEDEVTFVESDVRKSAFLRAALRAANLTATVRPSRIEAIRPHQAHFLTVRALASLDRLFGYAAMHLVPVGKLYALKGVHADAEIAEAERNWNAEIKTYGLDGGGVIVEASQISRR